MTAAPPRIAIQSGREREFITWKGFEAVEAPSTRPYLTVLLVMVTDALAAAAACYLGGWTLGADYVVNKGLMVSQMTGIVGILLAAFAAARLYPPVGFSAREEWQRVAWSGSAAYLAILVAAGVAGAADWVVESLIVAWAGTLALVPLARAALRRAFSHREWWGLPVVLAGGVGQSRSLMRRLERQPWLGLKPVAVMDFARVGGWIDRTPVIGRLGPADDCEMALTPLYSLLTVIQCAAGEGIPRQEFLSRLWVKRMADVVLSLAIGVVVLPVIGIIALLIKLDSPGPVFYGHVRIGQCGRYFKSWKFRSMVVNGDEVLRRCLAKDPALRAEWEATQKIKRDPRVTRVGRLLRKTSLDELPQLWNVLIGEMSLVGPRPIVHSEVSRYGDRFDAFVSVKPGVTGLWQVMGRNNTTYDRRVSLDLYYARRWSLWLDLKILFRTIPVVVSGSGAY